MSKRVNNHKGWPSKNKANNRMVNRWRKEQDQLKKLRAEKGIGEELVEKVMSRFKEVSTLIKMVTPKRFNRTR